MNKKIIFYTYVFLAHIRGLFLKYPAIRKSLDGKSTVSCGLRNFNEVKVMFYNHDWKPYWFRKDKYGYSRVFITGECLDYFEGEKHER